MIARRFSPWDPLSELSDALKFDDSHAPSEQQHLAKAIDR